MAWDRENISALSAIDVITVEVCGFLAAWIVDPNWNDLAARAFNIEILVNERELMVDNS